MTIKILFAGLDNSGKSTLVCSLAVYLRLLGYSVGLHEIDPWSDSHEPILGIKTWSERAKKKFGEVGARDYSLLVENYVQDDSDIVLGDLHGRIQEPLLHSNAGMLAQASDGAILFNRADRVANVNADFPQSIQAWEGFFDDHGIDILARVYSQQVSETEELGHINAKGLERAVLPYHPALPQLAQTITQVPAV